MSLRIFILSQAATLDAWGRLFHPAEIGLIHEERQNMLVDQDMELAWKIMGNLILPYQYHAMIPLMQVANHFLPTDLQSRTLWDGFCAQRLTKCDLKQTHVEFALLTCPMKSLCIQTFSGACRLSWI